MICKILNSKEGNNSKSFYKHLESYKSDTEISCFISRMVKNLCQTYFTTCM